MAKRSKAFNELLSLQKNQLVNKEDRFKGLIERVQQSPLGELKTKIVIEPKGQEKMSDVLEEFIAPYMDLVLGKEGRRNLLLLAMTAWNISLLPKEQRQETIDKFFTEVLQEKDLKTLEEGKKLVNDLIARKTRYFGHILRYILDFELKEQGDEYYLSVASTPMKPSGKE